MDEIVITINYVNAVIAKSTVREVTYNSKRGKSVLDNELYLEEKRNGEIYKSVRWLAKKTADTTAD